MIISKEKQFKITKYEKGILLCGAFCAGLRDHIRHFSEPDPMLDMTRWNLVFAVTKSADSPPDTRYTICSPNGKSKERYRH